MDYQYFYEWLKNDKGMSERSSKDVVSRLKRVIRMTGLTDINNIKPATIEQSKEYTQLSTFIKSQLKRSVVLYNEFKGQNGEE
mgnify:CR=1 FL=1